MFTLTSSPLLSHPLGLMPKKGLYGLSWMSLEPLRFSIEKKNPSTHSMPGNPIQTLILDCDSAPHEKLIFPFYTSNLTQTSLIN